MGDNALIEQMSDIYKSWDGENRRTLATRLLEVNNLDMKVSVRDLKGAYGSCALNYRCGENMIISSFNLNSMDARNDSHKIKTIFHELFHAKSNGLKQDVGIVGFENWAYIDDVFAESTAHYLNKSMGIKEEIMPSYPKHLIKALPKLKKLKEFKHCKTIVDFGEVAYNYRFGNNSNAKWSQFAEILLNAKNDFNVYEYSKQYLDYIKSDKEDIIDLILKNMPSSKKYKSEMIQSLKISIQNIENNKELTGKEEILFNNALIVAMNRKGVK